MHCAKRWELQMLNKKIENYFEQQLVGSSNSCMCFYGIMKGDTYHIDRVASTNLSKFYEQYEFVEFPYITSNIPTVRLRNV